jgi:hypothetical protein
MTLLIANSLPIVWLLAYPIGTIVWYLVDTKIINKKKI